MNQTDHRRQQVCVLGSTGSVGASTLDVLARHPDLHGVHDLRTRTSGNQDFVQFHVWVDPQMSVSQAHRVMDEIEARLRREFPGVEILIHPDPAGLVNEEGIAAEDVLPQDTGSRGPGNRKVRLTPDP